MVTGGDSCITGCEFESQHHISRLLIFSHLNVVEFYYWLKINNKETRPANFSVFLKSVAVTLGLLQNIIFFVTLIIYDAENLPNRFFMPKWVCNLGKY